MGFSQKKIWIAVLVDYILLSLHLLKAAIPQNVSVNEQSESKTGLSFIPHGVKFKPSPVNTLMATLRPIPRANLSRKSSSSFLGNKDSTKT